MVTGKCSKCGEERELNDVHIHIGVPVEKNKSLVTLWLCKNCTDHLYFETGRWLGTGNKY